MSKMLCANNLLYIRLATAKKSPQPKETKAWNVMMIEFEGISPLFIDSLPFHASANCLLLHWKTA
jgi:hypothetical protein